MRFCLFLLILVSALSFAKEMPQDGERYAFVSKVFTALGVASSDCDQSAIEDPHSEWRCASYAEDYASFIRHWQAMLEQHREYPILAISKWKYFTNEANEIDFYARAYQLVNNDQLIIAYDPSEEGREVFIGMSEGVGGIVHYAKGSLVLETMQRVPDAPDVSMSDLLISALMADFAAPPPNDAINEMFTTRPFEDAVQGPQPALNAPTSTATTTQDASESDETPPPLIPTSAGYNYCNGFSSQEAAQTFYNQSGFSLENDPYNLDKNKNGVPCEGSDLL